LLKLQFHRTLGFCNGMFLHTIRPKKVLNLTGRLSKYKNCEIPGHTKLIVFEPV
jgi:hypothetical protein